MEPAGGNTPPSFHTSGQFTEAAICGAIPEKAVNQTSIAKNVGGVDNFERRMIVQETDLSIAAVLAANEPEGLHAGEGVAQVPNVINQNFFLAHAESLLAG